ncbi:hypothetical protein FOL46_008921 [Perkinsus olseni]|uniref:CKK domain-containing protein n=1 Tax=Perkinsus olseni TaxID=32597 RepID=A0A7J6MM95_PEROL|nr:hypothetical protein FOL46_008921 [Perkinsus olseni]
MFASPNPKFTVTGRRRNSTGSPSLSELSPRMKQGIEAAVRRAKLARERRNSLALPPPVRRRSTLKGMIPVETPSQATAEGGRASQVAESGRERRASSPAVEGEAGPPVVTTRAREMGRQSVTRPLATPELVSRMETWIDEIRAELLEVESELTEGPASLETDGIAGVTPRGSLTTPRLRGAGILSRLLAVQETDGPSGAAEVTRSSSQSERSSPARSGATESVIADAPESLESSVSPVSSSSSVTASPPMQPMSDEPSLVADTPADSPYTEAPTELNESNTTMDLGGPTRERLDGMVEDIQSIERSAFKLRCAVNRMISDQSAVLTHRSVMSAQSSPRLTLGTPRLEDAGPLSARSSIGRPRHHSLMSVDLRAPPPISRGSHVATVRETMLTPRGVSRVAYKFPTARDIYSAVHRGMKPWDVSVVLLNKRFTSGTSPTNSSRMQTLSEKLNRIRQQRRALDELTNSDYIDHGSRTSSARQSLSTAGRGGGAADRHAGTSRLSSGWAGSKEEDSPGRRLPSTQNITGHLIGYVIPPIDVYVDESADARHPMPERTLPASAATSSSPRSGAVLNDDKAAPTLPPARPVETTVSGYECDTDRPELVPAADGSRERRRSLGESWYRLERQRSIEGLVLNAAGATEHCPQQVPHDEPEEQLRESPAAFQFGAQDYGGSGEYLDSYANTSGMYSSYGTGDNIGSYDDGGPFSNRSGANYQPREREETVPTVMYYDEEEGEDSEGYDGNGSYPMEEYSTRGDYHSRPPELSRGRWEENDDGEALVYGGGREPGRDGYEEGRATEVDWSSRGRGPAEKGRRSYDGSSHGVPLSREEGKGYFMAERETRSEVYEVGDVEDPYLRRGSDTDYGESNEAAARGGDAGGVGPLPDYYGWEAGDGVYGQSRYQHSSETYYSAEEGYPYAEEGERRRGEGGAEQYGDAEGGYAGVGTAVPREHHSRSGIYHGALEDVVCVEGRASVDDGVISTGSAEWSSHEEGPEDPALGMGYARDGYSSVSESVTRRIHSGGDHAAESGLVDGPIALAPHQYGDSGSLRVGEGGPRRGGAGGGRQVEKGEVSVAQSITGWHLRDSFDPRSESPAPQGVELSELSTREASVDVISTDINPFELCSGVIRKRREAADIRDFFAAEMWREKTELKLRREEGQRLRGLVVEELRRRSEETPKSSRVVAECDAEPSLAMSPPAIMAEESAVGSEEASDDHVGYRTKGGVLVELDPDINKFDSPDVRRARENPLERRKREAERRISSMRDRPNSAVTMAPQGVRSPARVSPTRIPKTPPRSEEQQSWLPRGLRRPSSSASSERRTPLSCDLASMDSRTTNLGNNRKIVINAISWALLGGAVNKKNREAVLSAATSRFNKLVVLFKDEVTGRQVYRALYGFDSEDQAFKRLHSVSSSPAILKEHHISKAYRYTSTTRSFREIPGHRALDAATDAVLFDGIHNLRHGV